MKKNCWLLMGLMIATSAVAQSNTNTPAPTAPSPIVLTSVTAPAPVVSTNAPAKKKHVVKRKRFTAVRHVALNEPAVTLIPGPAEVAADNVNVRGQAGLKGEFITHLSKGDAVLVLSQINLDKHQVDEPAQWAKIAFPTNAHVWVNSQFIDATNKTVVAKKLNLRAGPGENYSVLGVIERGTALDTVNVKGDWTEIQPPATAYAFISAMYLKQEASGTLAANVPPSTETIPPVATPEPTPVPAPTPAPVATAVPEAQPVVTTPPAPTPVPVTSAPVAPPVVAQTTPEPTPAPVPAPTAPALPDTNATAEVDTNLPPPGPVSLEGVVRHVSSVIEPTDFELYDPSTGTIIDYLYTSSTNLDLGRYKGLRIVATGEESLADRWPNTPVLTIEKIQVVK